MARVAAILEADPAPSLAVVLSAARGVTDALLNLIAAAERQEDVEQGLEAVRNRHVDMATELCDPHAASEFIHELDADCRDIASILHGVRLTRAASGKTRDLVAGFGEIWSTKLFARHLGGRGKRKAVQWVDAREIVQVAWNALGPSVQWESSRARAAGLRGHDHPATLVITGYIARDPKGLQTTLGRNGSDFSASIFADLLDATEICIWTDVDGVLSADPRRVPTPPSSTRCRTTRRWSSPTSVPK